MAVIRIDLLAGGNDLWIDLGQWNRRAARLGLALHDGINTVSEHAVACIANTVDETGIFASLGDLRAGMPARDARRTHRLAQLLCGFRHCFRLFLELCSDLRVHL